MIEASVKMSIVPFLSTITLAPVGILYLVPMSKPASFGVIVCFVVIFTAAMVLLGFRTAGTILGGCAYQAVIIGFLAQIAAGNDNYCCQ